MEYLIWFFIGLSWLLIFGLVAVWPMSLYNTFWLSVSNRNSSLPFYHGQGGGPGGVTFYYIDGPKRVIYGVLSLVCGLSLQLFAFDFVANFCASCYATPLQRYAIFCWLASLFAIAIWGQYYKSRRSYSESDQDGELFFWRGFCQNLVSMLSKKKDRNKRSS